MNRSKRAYTFVSLAAVFAVFFAAGTVYAAYNINVDLDNTGDGEGGVTFSATSSTLFEFTGWFGETCLGRGTCVLNRLIPNRLKRVTATFNAPPCTDYIYSDFGACGLDGRMRRAIIGENPPGCAGGAEQVTSWVCGTLNERELMPPPSYVPYTPFPDDIHTIPVIIEQDNSLIRVFYDPGCLTGCTTVGDYLVDVDQYTTTTYVVETERLVYYDTYYYVKKDPAYSVIISNTTADPSGTNPISGDTSGRTAFRVPYSDPSGDDSGYLNQQQAREAAAAQLDQKRRNEAALINDIYNEKVTCKDCGSKVVIDRKEIEERILTGTATEFDRAAYNLDLIQAEIDADAAYNNLYEIEYLADQAREAAAADPDDIDLRRAALEMEAILWATEKNIDAVENNLDNDRFGDVAINTLNTDLALANAKNLLAKAGIIEKSVYDIDGPGFSKPCQNVEVDDRTWFDKFLDFFLGDDPEEPTPPPSTSTPPPDLNLSLERPCY